MQVAKIIYWLTTLLVCTMMLTSGIIYLVSYEMVQGDFAQWGYPAQLIYPLASGKILGSLAILSRQSKILKEWAYAGFFFNLFWAFYTHISLQDGKFGFALLGLMLCLVSYYFDKKVFTKA